MPRRAYAVATLLALIALAAPLSAQAASTGRHSDAIVVISGDVGVSRGETVDGVFVVSGDANVAGRVDGDLVVLSGDLTLSGTVDGDVIVASGLARLLPSAEVTGDVRYGDEHPDISLDARVRGDVAKQGWPEIGTGFAWIGGFLVWLAFGVSAASLGVLLILIAPRAADSIHARSRERIGPVIAIGIAIAIVLPVAGFVAAITLLGLPLAVAILLALLPLSAIAYSASAWVLGRAILKPPRERVLSFLAGMAILRLLALVPILGLLVDLAAVVFGLGLIGAAIGAAREPEAPATARSPGI